MRHQKKGHRLGRTTPHRKRTLAALSNALIEHKRIKTTVAKAKALRPFIEPLITRAKSDTVHNRRQVFRRLQDKTAISELFGDVAEQVADRPGGYTRVIKLGQRFGDGTEMAMVELVDYNDVKPEGSSGGRSRTRRGSGKGRRRKKKQKEQKAAEASAAAEETAEAEDATAETEDKAAKVDAAETDVAEADTEAADTEAADTEAADREAAEADAADAADTEAEAEATKADAEAETEAELEDDEAKAEEKVKGDKEDTKDKE